MHGDRFYPKNTFLIGETERKNSFWFHFSPWAVLLFLLLLLLVFFANIRSGIDLSCTCCTRNYHQFTFGCRLFSISVFWAYASKVKCRA